MPLAPSLLLKGLLQNGDLTVPGGVDIELSRSFQGIGVKQDHGVLLAIRGRNAQMRTKLVVGSLGGSQAVFAGQGERTGFAINGGDFPEGRAAVHEGVVIDDGADDGGVVENDGSVGSGDELGVGGGARQALGVVLSIAALHGVGEEVTDGR